MKYVNSTLRSEQADKLRTSIKRLKLSKNLADYCLENASAKVLNFINDMFAEEGRLENCFNSFKKLDLLIIDEWGYCQLDKQSAGYVFQIVSDSYERKSLIITTNLPFSEWGRIVTDEQLAAAIIDRIVHYGHLIDCGKKDWRIATSPMNNQTFVEKKEAQKTN